MTITVTTNLDVTDPNDGLLSLREALVLTNAGADDDIVFDLELKDKTLLLEHGELRISADVLIDGSRITIDADYGSRVFSMYGAGGAPDPRVTLANMTIANGSTDGVGGAIFSEGYLALRLCSVTNSNAEGGIGSSGGGIYGEDVYLFRSTVSGNFTYNPDGPALGGGVAAHSLTVSNSTIAGNQALSANDTDLRGYGGGIGIIGDGAVSIVDSTITANYAGFQGGGISGGTITIAN